MTERTDRTSRIVRRFTLFLLIVAPLIVVFSLLQVLEIAPTSGNPFQAWGTLFYSVALTAIALWLWRRQEKWPTALALAIGALGLMYLGTSIAAIIAGEGTTGNNVFWLVGGAVFTTVATIRLLRPQV